MGVCCAPEDSSLGVKGSQGRVTFNNLRGFCKIDDITKIYNFKQKIGAGQFGTVFYGLNKIVGAECAIKRIEKKLVNRSKMH